jgi:hypothetical protein
MKPHDVKTMILDGDGKGSGGVWVGGERISEHLRTVAAAIAAPMMAWRTFVTRSGGDGIAYRIRVTAKHGRYSTSEPG